MLSRHPTYLRFPAHFLTERLQLRQWRSADIGPLAAMNADPRVMRHSPTLTSYQSASAMDGWRDHISRFGWGLWAVERKDTREWIGFAGLNAPNLKATHSPCIEVNWRFAFAHWGNGFATEAALAAVRAGFDHLLLDEIVAFADIRDLRSQRVLQRLGMRDDDPALRNSGIQGDTLSASRCLFRLSRSAPTLRSFASELETSPAGPLWA